MTDQTLLVFDGALAPVTHGFESPVVEERPKEGRELWTVRVLGRELPKTLPDELDNGSIEPGAVTFRAFGALLSGEQLVFVDRRNRSDVPPGFVDGGAIIVVHKVRFLVEV